MGLLFLQMSSDDRKSGLFFQLFCRLYFGIFFKVIFPEFIFRVFFFDTLFEPPFLTFTWSEGSPPPLAAGVLSPPPLAAGVFSGAG